MSDLQGIALIITAVTGLVAAVFSGVAAIYAARAHRDIKIVEKATNSMKDALVKSTGDARFLEGKTEERLRPESGKSPHNPM